jgi:hypothetical protein
LKRRHLNASQRAVIAVDLMPMLEEEAKKRHDKLSGTRRNPNEVVANLPQPATKAMERKSSTQAGKLANVGERYVREIKKLRDAGKKENIEEIRTNKKTLQDIKKEERLEKIKKQRKKGVWETTTPKLLKCIQMLTRNKKFKFVGWTRKT